MSNTTSSQTTHHTTTSRRGRVKKLGMEAAAIYVGELLPILLFVALLGSLSMESLDQFGIIAFALTIVGTISLVILQTVASRFEWTLTRGLTRFTALFGSLFLGTTAVVFAFSVQSSATTGSLMEYVFLALLAALLSIGPTASLLGLEHFSRYAD